MLFLKMKNMNRDTHVVINADCIDHMESYEGDATMISMKSGHDLLVEPTPESIVHTIHMNCETLGRERTITVEVL